MGVDEIPAAKEPPTREEVEFLEAMSRLVDNPFFRKLVGAVEEERERAIANMSRQVAFNGGAHVEPVNQRVIDHTRGFWNGARFAVTNFPNQKAKNWDKFVASDNDDGSESS